jgi:hypothetical protein
MAGTRAPFASLAALAAVASAHAEQKGASATETAKKDLQSLPTIQRPAETLSSSALFPGTSSIPGLSVGSPNGAVPSEKERNEAALGKSKNWLLDGVNQIEAEANAQREAAGGVQSGDRSQTTRSGERPLTAGTTNPFAEYLTQWISPGDQALLSTGPRNAISSPVAPWEIARSDFSREASLDPRMQPTSNPFQMELPGLSSLPGGKMVQNPYLADPFQAEATLGAPSGRADAREPAGALPSILTPSQGPRPTVVPMPAPIEQARPAPTTPPTERLIDDRKYFPQLRRF